MKLDGDYGDSQNGAFFVKLCGRNFKVIASNGGDWEHVSVSNEHETPSWEIMQAIKEIFFGRYAVVMQLHVGKKDYINNHEHCLHLWRPLKEKIPQPPKIFV